MIPRSLPLSSFIALFLLSLILSGCAINYGSLQKPDGTTATTYEGRVLADVGIWKQVVKLYDSFTQTLFNTTTDPLSPTPPAVTDGEDGTPSSPDVEPEQPVSPEQPPVEPPTEPETPAYELTGKEVAILWKPDAEKDHKLVVIPNSSYPNSTVVKIGDETGKFSGRKNPDSKGDRPHYRFSKPGRDYPDPSFLQVGDRTFLITKPAERHEILKEVWR